MAPADMGGAVGQVNLVGGQVQGANLLPNPNLVPVQNQSQTSSSNQIQ